MIHNLLHSHSLLALILVFTSMNPLETVYAETTSSNSSRYIQVRGYGKVAAVPDKAELAVAVEIQAKTAKEGRQKSAEAMASMIKSIKNQTIQDKDIQTGEFSLYPIYVPNTANKISGYRLTNQIRISIRNLELVSTVIDTAISTGGDAARIQGLNFMIANPEPFMAKAREYAFADAQRKAFQYAQLAKAKLHLVLSITEDSGANPRPQPYAMDRAVMMANTVAESTPVEAGEQEITASVTVVFELN